MVSVKMISAALIAAAGLFAISAEGADKTGNQHAAKRAGPLANLPSAPGPHMSRIAALGDNEWITLGSPAPDPTWGKGAGRTWGAKMPYAPDLQGAFLGGQGVHGAVKGDGHYDDWFFYDVNGNRWICIYPGINVSTLVADIKKGDLKMNDDGQLVDKKGEPQISIGAHIYQSHTYDSDLKKYICCGGSTNGMPLDQHTAGQPWSKDAIALLTGQMKGKTERVMGMPTFFDTVSGKWERPGAKNERPGGGVMQYVPSKKAVWIYNGRTILYDSVTQKVTDLSPKGELLPQGIDYGSCLDTKRNRIYVGGGSYRAPYKPNEGFIYVYDIETNTWSNFPNKGLPPDNYDANTACMHYDSANDVVFVIDRNGDRQGIFILDLDKLTWGEAPLPIRDDVPRAVWNGFYSPEVNAHFFHIAGDSSDNGTMWVYRYKRPVAAGKKAKKTGH